MNNINKDTLQQIQDRFPNIERKVDELIPHVKLDTPLRGFYETVMKNQVEYCDRQNKIEKAPIHNIIKLIAINTLDGLQPIHEIIGVQPMTGPVGMIYKLRHNIEPKEGEDRRFSLEILGVPIEAGSKKLSARANIVDTPSHTKSHARLEPLQDNAFGKNDIIQKLGQEIADEYSAEVVSILTRYAKSHDNNKQPESYRWRTVKYTNISKPGDFLCTINVYANRIADKTRRACGNFIIINQKILDTIKDTKQYVPFSEEVPDGYLKQVGWLNEHYKVFLDKYDTENNVIVGYKGAAGETDAGLFFAPYVPVMSTGIVINPLTFEPCMTFMTRYALYADKMSKDYYSGFNVSFNK